jgi:hypothetical protein
VSVSINVDNRGCSELLTFKVGHWFIQNRPPPTEATYWAGPLVFFKTPKAADFCLGAAAVMPWAAIPRRTVRAPQRPGSLGGYIVNLTKDQLDKAPKYHPNDSWDWGRPNDQRVHSRLSWRITSTSELDGRAAVRETPQGL